MGINAYVAHANQSVFGEDVDAFRPERWMGDQESAAKMDNYFLTVSRPPVILTMSSLRQGSTCDV